MDIISDIFTNNDEKLIINMTKIIYNNYNDIINKINVNDNYFIRNKIFKNDKINNSVYIAFLMYMKISVNHI